ncbi:2-amino-4-hydroxy-6-hydroxymethyldihydropteridine diphosphokinase [Frigoriglobus tundricola]|uniref:2-amino-4-hydroxy-6-hydroxymethyldihydropteridine pyrophosphokinase n=1 Tax=Frigoriglobus tundricola TaxID=2774151 RepID=A0A6M5YUC9_9BACT|nr:2-amino-4-hydroxy-6-hydroxymethyldihydropteridine diphosphokinase [Frigoriglobus tundricola]QJW96913.1 2-amino-4-hydroxy-6-hydroxymethyldihydropteridine pyrophosphokinase [Frigoriglobus tundricola]
MRALVRIGLTRPLTPVGRPNPMTTAYVALGSNLGDRWATLSAAVRRLRAEPGVRVTAVSAFHETAPVDCPPGSGEFLNAAAAIETDRPPEDVLELLFRIERQFGRVRSEPNSPRTLDLDLILYGDRVIGTPALTLPHPRMHLRAFVLVPLAEIAAGAVHPVLGKTVGELAAAVAADDIRPVPRPPLPQTLTGLRALVTGSTSGIGLSIANEFRARGADVVTHGRRPGSGHHVAADLRDPAACDRLADEVWSRFGSIDVLVCNAGADTLTGDAAKWSFDEKLDALLAVDLRATMRLSRGLGGRMKARGRGCVLTVGWDQAETGMEGDSGQLFAAVKGAVTCFTRSLALSLAPEVRVNCLAPGWIRTAWGETASHVWQDRVRSETPLGVWGLAEDVAAAAAWLASPAAAFVTGQTVRVNGGAINA